MIDWPIFYGEAVAVSRAIDPLAKAADLHEKSNEGLEENGINKH